MPQLLLLASLCTAVSAQQSNTVTVSPNTGESGDRVTIHFDTNVTKVVEVKVNGVPVATTSEDGIGTSKIELCFAVPYDDTDVITVKVEGASKPDLTNEGTGGDGFDWDTCTAPLE